MSKKDYELLAKALKDSKPQKYPLEGDRLQVALVQWNSTVEIIAFDLANNNIRFNRNKFLSACGYNE